MIEVKEFITRLEQGHTGHFCVVPRTAIPM